MTVGSVVDGQMFTIQVESTVSYLNSEPGEAGAILEVAAEFARSEQLLPRWEFAFERELEPNRFFVYFIPAPPGPEESQAFMVTIVEERTYRSVVIAPSPADAGVILGDRVRADRELGGVQTHTRMITDVDVRRVVRGPVESSG